MSMTIGLCEACIFHSLVVSSKGTEFHLCEKSKTNPSFPRYPRLPVKECEGFQAEKNTPNESPHQ